MKRRVIFPDPSIWTKEHTMTDQPAPVNRPLTDPERHLIAHLAAAVLAQQTGCTIEVAADVLGTYADEGRMHLKGDSVDCHLTVDGKVLVHVTREFLSFFASNPDEVIDLDKYATYFREEDQQ